jgi:hypothetical protein
VPNYAGKVASITISTTARPYAKFDLDFTSEVIDTTSFIDAGYQSNEAGVFGCNVSFDGPYDGAEAFTQGQSVSTVFALGGGGPSFTVAFRISNIRISTAARNQVAQIAVSGQSNGTFTVTF